MTVKTDLNRDAVFNLIKRNKHKCLYGEYQVVNLMFSLKYFSLLIKENEFDENNFFVQKTSIIENLIKDLGFSVAEKVLSNNMTAYVFNMNQFLIMINYLNKKKKVSIFQ